MNEFIERGLEKIGIEGDEKKIELSARYLVAVREASRALNLIAAMSIEDLIEKHYLDSLFFLKHDKFMKGTLLDLGTGAGFPGIPLKIFSPQISLCLLDSSRRKINFLKFTVQKMALQNTHCLHGRAEDCGRREEYRERFQYVCSRAVAPMPKLLEMGLPFVSIGGVMIAYKGPKGESELQGIGSFLELLGGKLEKRIFYELPSGDSRVLYIFKKTAKTSAKYPRRRIKPVNLSVK
ncbi:MAG: 16S rRNA (guanine(527)-N(7))-methyltransferase RsmG [Firmicutes bacterium]|nr:16S rRNA (guanine(527)-N(7))-methyltransferase RsmG [Bacillota bacterium]